MGQEMKPKVSLFASSIRPHLWEAMVKSLRGTSVPYEIVFAGNNKEDFSIENEEQDLSKLNFDKPIETTYESLFGFHYIDTANIKPAQAYEVARRACTGELILWIADDGEFPDDVIGKAYRFYKENCDYKDIVCMKTRENYGTWLNCDNTQHHFFGNAPDAPKMCPIGLMNRVYFDQLGGIDRRYICGQWDNSTMIQIYNDGGKLHYFDEGVIELDHYNKHDNKCISSKRPFGQGYEHDRKILEGSWGKRGQMVYKIPYERFDDGFEAYVDKDILTKSQSYTIKELWES